MKNIFLLLAAPFIFFAAQAETVTQTEADNIVLERLSQETRQYTIYAKDGVQSKMTITSANGEVLEVNYKFWLYYIDYTGNVGKYIIVKESNGNVLEVNVTSDADLVDLEGWRIVDSRNSDKIYFCSCLNLEDINKTIPIINEFLAGLPDSVSKEQTFESLETWLNSFPCSIDAKILYGVDIIWGREQMYGVAISINDNEIVRELELDFAVIQQGGNLVLTYSQIAGYLYYKQDAIYVKTEFTKIDKVFDFINSLEFDVKRIDDGCYISSMPADSANLKYIRSNLLAKPYVDNGFGVAAHLNWYTSGITFFVPLLDMHNRDYQTDWIKTMNDYKLVEWNFAMMIVFYIPEGTGKQWETTFGKYDFVRWTELSYTRYRIR